MIRRSLILTAWQPKPARFTSPRRLLPIRTLPLRILCLCLGASAIQASGLAATSGDASPPARPNVIFIIADDMGYADIGSYGGQIDTPHLDELASKGLRFRQFYNNAKCETTRSALMSGLFHNVSGLKIQNGTTLAAAMKSVGYRTYAVGKWHLGDSPDQIPVARGFDSYYGCYGGGTDYFDPKPPKSKELVWQHLDAAHPGGLIPAYDRQQYDFESETHAVHARGGKDYYATDAYGDHAVAFLNNAVEKHADQPFFMYLAFNAPHTPAEAPEALIEKYLPRVSKGWDITRQEIWERQKQLGLIDPNWSLPESSPDIPRWDALSDKEREHDTRKRAAYSGQVDSLDQNIGKLLKRLEELDATTHPGIVDNTIILFCSDNGCQGHGSTADCQRAAWAAVSNTPFRYYKRSQHQGGICSPMIVRWPSVIKAQTITDEPGHVIDIMATLVDIADIDYRSLKKPNGEAAPAMAGKSLLPIFQGGTRPAPDYWGFELSGQQFGLIQGDWKLVSLFSSPWRLYNLKDDRTETKNLRWEHPEKAKELEGLYREWAAGKRTYEQRDGYSKDAPTRHFRYLSINGMQEPSIGFSHEDIGTVQNSDFSDQYEYYRVTTASQGFSDGSDNFSYFFQDFQGDGELIGYLDLAEDTNRDSVTGLMIRESSKPDSPFVMTGWNAAGEIYQLSRPAAGGPLVSQAGAEKIKPPVFLRAVREGDQFTSSYSGDGYTWTDFATTEASLSRNAHGGIAGASGDPQKPSLFQWREWRNHDQGEPLVTAH